VGLHRRATQGGSWACRTSLVQYDMFVLSLGLYPSAVQNRLRETHDREFFQLRHCDSVDEVGRRALRSIKRLHPHLFSEGNMLRAWSHGFGAEIRWPREALGISGLAVGHVRPARPNGADAPGWTNWEEDYNLLECE
jgi:hypothetical protein